MCPAGTCWFSLATVSYCSCGSFGNSGHFPTRDAPRRFGLTLGGYFPLTAFVLCKPAAGRAVPVPWGEQEQRGLLGTPAWALAIVTPLWRSRGRAVPVLLTGH